MLLHPAVKYKVKVLQSKIFRMRNKKQLEDSIKFHITFKYRFGPSTA